VYLCYFENVLGEQVGNFGQFFVFGGRIRGEGLFRSRILTLIRKRGLGIFVSNLPKF